jgi:hypothetical protein
MFALSHLKCHVERSETSVEILRYTANAQNDIHNFSTFVRSLLLMV